MSEEEATKPSRWCLVGNIVGERPYGVGGVEIRSGTKNFTTGTKVYCLPMWDDEQIVVVGRHRGSKRFVQMVIRIEWIKNWRAQRVYHPYVLKLLDEAAIEHGRRNWTDKEQVESVAECLRNWQVAPAAELIHTIPMSQTTHSPILT